MKGLLCMEVREGESLTHCRSLEIKNHRDESYIDEVVIHPC